MIGPIPLAAFAVVLASTFFHFSWRMHRRGIDRRALLLLMGGGLVLRLVMVIIPHLHSWDERYHALVAKNMIVDPFRPVLYPDPGLPYVQEDWTKSHIWVHKPPLPLWTMAASMAVLGVELTPLRLPSLMLSLLLIWICHGIALRLFDRRVAWIAALLMAIHGLAIQLTGGGAATDHVDVFLLFFTTLAMYGAVRWREGPSTKLAVFVGLAAGCAVLSKWLVGLFPLLFLLVPQQAGIDPRTKGLHLLFAGLACAAVALPWEIHINLNFPEEVGLARDKMLGHFDRDLEGHAEPWYYHLHKLGMLYGELVYLPLVWLFWRCMKDRSAPRIALLTIWIIVPYVIFSLARTKMQAYTIIAAPAIFMAIALFIRELPAMVPAHWQRVLLIAVLLAMPYRQMLERIKPWRSELDPPEWMHRISTVPDGASTCMVVFNEPHAIEMMFHRDVVAYDRAPMPEEIELLRKRDCRILNMEMANAR